MTYARDLKLDLKRFRNDLAGEEVRKRIDLDLQRARVLNVQGTPTIAINGELIQPARLEYLDSEIESRLK